MAISIVDVKNGLDARMKDADKKLNDLFSKYGVGEDVVGIDAKLAHAKFLAGSDADKRKEINEAVSKLRDELNLTNEGIVEDFNAMTDGARKDIKKLEDNIKETEEKYEKQLAEKENLENKIKDIDGEVALLNARKVELIGADGKGGTLAAEIENKRNETKKFDELTQKIKDNEKKMKENEAEIDKLKLEADDALNNGDQAKSDEIWAKINGLRGENTGLLKSNSDMKIEGEQIKANKAEIGKKITGIENEVASLDDNIKNKNEEKDHLQKNLNFLPKAADELKNLKDRYSKMREDYVKAVGEMEKSLNERGLKVKAKDLDVKEEDEPIVETPEDEKKEGKKDDGKEDKKEDNKNKKEDNTKTNAGGAPFVAGGPIQGENLPVVTPEQKKKANFDYIVGYSNDGIGLPSEDRLKRIQSELGGRDYEAMVNAFHELEKSPIGLTRDEKKQIKNMMEEDKDLLSNSIKDVDVDKLMDIFDTVGVKMDRSKVRDLHGSSFEGKEMLLDRIMNSKDGSSKHGIVNGFASMTSAEKGMWEDVINNYAKSKDTMTEEQRKEFEKYVLTPIKFGTLQLQSKELCQNKVSKFFSKIVGKDSKIADIRAAIANAELGQGEQLRSQTKSKNFTDDLRGGIVTDPPTREVPPRGDDDKSKGAR